MGRSICFLLSSCDKKGEDGVVSGEKGCIVPSDSFTLFNLIDGELTNCEATFEPTATCPKQTVAKIAKGGSHVFTYFPAPPAIACTKLMEVRCTSGADECKTDGSIDKLPFPNLFVKKKLTGTGCEIASSPKSLAG